MVESTQQQRQQRKLKDDYLLMQQENRRLHRELERAAALPQPCWKMQRCDVCRKEFECTPMTHFGPGVSPSWIFGLANVECSICGDSLGDKVGDFAPAPVSCPA